MMIYKKCNVVVFTVALVCFLFSWGVSAEILLFDDFTGDEMDEEIWGYNVVGEDLRFEDEMVVIPQARHTTFFSQEDFEWEDGLWVRWIVRVEPKKDKAGTLDYNVDMVFNNMAVSLAIGINEIALRDPGAGWGTRDAVDYEYERGGVETFDVIAYFDGRTGEAWVWRYGTEELLAEFEWRLFLPRAEGNCGFGVWQSDGESAFDLIVVGRTREAVEAVR